MTKYCLCLLLLFSTIREARAIKPNLRYDRTPATVGLVYDSLNISTANHQRLTAWLCHSAKGNDAKKVMLLAGPDAGNMGNQLDIAQAIVANLHVDVLMFDYRGFGTSDRVPIDSDLIAMPEFADDLSAALRYVQTNLQPDTSKIFIYGRSMGASLAITVGASQAGLGGVVAESPYISQESLRKFYTAEYKRTKSPRTVNVIEADRLEPMLAANRLRCPLMLVHGELEQPITTDEIYHLFSKCKSQHKSLWIASDADHLQVPFINMSAFLTLMYGIIGK